MHNGFQTEGFFKFFLLLFLKFLWGLAHGLWKFLGLGLNP